MLISFGHNGQIKSKSVNGLGFLNYRAVCDTDTNIAACPTARRWSGRMCNYGLAVAATDWRRALISITRLLSTALTNRIWQYVNIHVSAMATTAF